MPDLIPLTREKIDQIFEDAEQQADYILALYEVAYPGDWETVEKFDPYPEVNAETWQYIADKSIEFDKKRHPDVFAGGAWMNRGFSIAMKKQVPDWQILPGGIIVKEEYLGTDEGVRSTTS
jgi:hypothetical protein